MRCLAAVAALLVLVQCHALHRPSAVHRSRVARPSLSWPSLSLPSPSPSSLAATRQSSPSPSDDAARSGSSRRNKAAAAFLLTLATSWGSWTGTALADASTPSESAAMTTAADAAAAADTKEKVVPQKVDVTQIKVPYNHENVAFGPFLGKKATILFNMKIDDPQTVTQFPTLKEIYNKYGSQGLNVHAFPSEQGWFEPDDDETCRAKAKEYYGFGDYPSAAVFDKIDLLGPSANPLYAAITKALPTPNGYGRITLNYEKFLLDADGNPVRRYPRKYTAYDMAPDIEALLAGRELPPETLAYQKAWREAKREASKSEYSFRYNYNYYTAPDSMYKYNSDRDAVGDRDAAASSFKKAGADALFKK